MSDERCEPADTMPDIISRLNAACYGMPYAKILWPHRLLHDAVAEIAAGRDRERALRLAASAANEEICQTLGRALGYPRYADDPTNFPDARDADGVCVGDHVAETITVESAAWIAAAKEREAGLVGHLKTHACKCTGRCAVFEHLPADNHICLDRAAASLLDTHLPNWRTAP